MTEPTTNLQPWEATYDAACDEYQITQAGEPICFIDFQTLPDKHQLHLSLIKLAPSLMAALVELVNEPQPLGIDRPAYQKAISVLDLVEGGAA